MEIQGKIIAVLPAKTGVSQKSGKPWMTQEYVIETTGQYAKKVPFEVFGEDKIKQFNIQLGDEMTVQFDIEGSEWNGRWFAKVRAYNITKTTLSFQQPQSEPMAVIYPDKQPKATVPTASAAGTEDDSDLPF